MHFELRENGKTIKPEPMDGINALTNGGNVTSSNTPSVPQDKTLIQASGDTKVFWLQNGRRYWVLNPDVLNRMSSGANRLLTWGWDRIHIFSTAITNGFPESSQFIVPPASCPNGGSTCSNGLLIRQKGQQKVYRLENGKKRWIKTAAIFNCRGYNWNDIIEVTASIMNSSPGGTDIATCNAPTSLPSEGEIAITMQVYDLFGRSISSVNRTSVEFTGNSFESLGQILSNGVYLAVITTRREDGTIVKSEVKKLVIVR